MLCPHGSSIDDDNPCEVCAEDAQWFMENLGRAIFEAAAWIMVARLNYLQKGPARDLMNLAKGDYGTREINAYWAGFPENDPYSRYTE